MAKPSVTAITFDKDIYDPGDTITATVTYESPNSYGGDGIAGYSLSVGLTDALTGDDNSTLSGQSGTFYVNTSPSAPDPMQVTEAVSVAAAGISASSLTKGSGTLTQVTSSVSAPPNSLLLLWVMGGNSPTATGLGLTWDLVTSLAGFDGYTLWCIRALTGATGVSGTVTIAGSGSATYDLDVVTGVNPTTPLVVSNTQTAAASSVTFNTAASTSNRFIAAVGQFESTGTPNETPTAWTQLASSTGTYFDVDTQVSPDTTELTASATAGGYAIGLELNAFVATTGAAPTSWTLVFNNVSSDGTGTAIFEAIA